MAELKDYRDESRTKWGTEAKAITRDDIRLGALLRIADSLENMERPFKELIEKSERAEARADQYQRWYKEEMHKASAYKGLYKKAKVNNG